MTKSRNNAEYMYDKVEFTKVDTRNFLLTKIKYNIFIYSKTKYSL